MNINNLLEGNNLRMGRMLSYSKSQYREDNPHSVCYFNANIVTARDGKIWFGDLDLTKDGPMLKTIAKEVGQTIYILREMDCRFENEDKDGVNLINKAVWNTDNEILFN